MRIISLVVFVLASSISWAQEVSNFTQFYVNPYLINASFAGTEGKTGLFMTYRHQWGDFEGAPQIGNLTFHTALNESVGLGLNLNNDQRGILNTSSAMLSASYSVRLSQDMYLRFGASAGAASNGVDWTLAGEGDPALLNYLDNNLFLIGNAGLSFHISNFHIGASMPDMFRPLLFSEESFGYEFQAAERFIISASNRFYFANNKHMFEPFILYRYHQVLPPQLEAAGILHLNHAVWLGGTYKQDFGISATGGFKIPKLFGVGYSYTFDNIGVNQIASPTHEVTINLLLGQRKKRSQKYSFISTVIEDFSDEEEEEIAEIEEEPEEEEIEEAPDEVEEELPEEEETEEEEMEPEMEENNQTENEKIDEPEETKPEPDRIEERVAVKKGRHLLELDVGEYVVVGAFSKFENAENYSDDLFMRGYRDAQFGYISEKKLWYVFIHKTENPEQSRKVRDDFRQIKEFSDAWVLGVEE